VDSPVALKSWEQKFDDKFDQADHEKNPEKKGQRASLNLRPCWSRAAVHSNDMRSMGGALWVFTEEKASTLGASIEGAGIHAPARSADGSRSNRQDVVHLRRKKPRLQKTVQKSSLKTMMRTEWDSAGVTFKPGQPTEDWLLKAGFLW